MTVVSIFAPHVDKFCWITRLEPLADERGIGARIEFREILADGLHYDRREIEVFDPALINGLRGLDLWSPVSMSKIGR
jgi:hypothetical protein